jgi:SAM-dependent methyltransferase
MIYTVNINNYDHPRTDNIKVFTNETFVNNSRNSRIIKILSHKYVDSEISIWVDGNIYLLKTENDIINEWLKDADMALFKHPIRNCIYDEQQAIKDLKRITDKNELNILDNQIDFYKQQGFPKNCNTLAETGIIIRKHNEKVIRFNENWWAEISRWSYRDQISFPIIYEKHKNDIKINFIEGDMRLNPNVKMIYHKDKINITSENATNKQLKISIITPTHNPKYLKDLEIALLEQSYTNWEWVILLNNDAEYESVDPRIKIFKSENNNTFVGALKKEACGYCTGEVIVEIDHDDFVIPNCLQEIYIAFQDTDVGFVYSKTIQLEKNFKPYNAALGWTYTKVLYRGLELYSMNNLPLYPANIGYIWYTPNHIRAWRKSVYDEIGGHDNTLEICDDQDLICRLYLKTKFKEIPKPLYFYRITGENTWLQKNEKIQKNTVNIYDKYINDLASRYCELTNTTKVNIYQYKPIEGYLNIHVDNLINQPIDENSVGLIKMENTLQYFENKNEVMFKLYKILIKGGILIISVPNALTQGGYMDPNAKSFWVQNSFWYYQIDKQQRVDFQIEKYQEIKFRRKRIYTNHPTNWHKTHDIGYINIHLEK